MSRIRRVAVGVMAYRTLGKSLRIPINRPRNLPQRKLVCRRGKWGKGKGMGMGMGMGRSRSRSRSVAPNWGWMPIRDPIQSACEKHGGGVSSEPIASGCLHRPGLRRTDDF